MSLGPSSKVGDRPSPARRTATGMAFFERNAPCRGQDPAERPLLLLLSWRRAIILLRCLGAGAPPPFAERCPRGVLAPRDLGWGFPYGASYCFYPIQEAARLTHRGVDGSFPWSRRVWLLGMCAESASAFPYPVARISSIFRAPLPPFRRKCPQKGERAKRHPRPHRLSANLPFAGEQK